MNDLQQLKQQIHNEDRVEELLHHMGCEHIKPVSNRYEAMLPEKFDSDNVRSVQVYHQAESLPCRVRSRGLSNIDIFGLVSFLVFDCEELDAIRTNLPKAKRWICDKLGYTYTTQNNFDEKEDPLAWLKKIRKQRAKRQLREFEDNKVYDDSILNQYVMYPHFQYLKEGIDYETQQEFQIGYDVNSDRIIYPIHNEFGEIISVKGRTSDSSYKEKNIYKFIYLYNFNKMITWYNWHRSLFYILDQKEVVIFESEKACWLASQWGHRNCVAISGDDISDYQADMIKRLGIDIKIVIALDKDKEAKDFKRQAIKFGVARPTYALWDAENLLSKDEKNSPTDRGMETFQKLYEAYRKYRINNVG